MIKFSVGSIRYTTQLTVIVKLLNEKLTIMKTTNIGQNV